MFEIIRAVELNLYRSTRTDAYSTRKDEATDPLLYLRAVQPNDEVRRPMSAEAAFVGAARVPAASNIA